MSTHTPQGLPRPRKRLGQHFLHDPAVLERVAAAIQPRPGDAMVEIGPGRGALTAVLLPRLERLDAVELDRDLIPLLEARVAGLGELRVHSADAVAFDFCALAPAPGSLRVVGNLPYNVSTPLIFHLIEQLACLRDLHFMLQREVAQRLAAGPGAAAYGRLGIMVQYRCEVESLFDVGTGAFTPPPKVVSSFVRLRPLPAPRARVRDEACFRQLVAQAFMHRRKTLRNAVHRLLTEAQIRAAGVDPQARPETLSIAQFAALSDAAAA